MRYISVFAGAHGELYDRLRQQPPNAFAPNGAFIVEPLPAEGYSTKYANAIIDKIASYIYALPEKEQVSIMMCYAAIKRGDLPLFLDMFFPYSICKEVPAIQIKYPASRNGINCTINSYIAATKKEYANLRTITKAIKEKTDVHNITPLLLPVRNFGSHALNSMLRRLFEEISGSSDPNALIHECTTQFIRCHPRVNPVGERASCFSNGDLYFKSPGRDRHGFYRHKKGDGHASQCLLNARCRLGGPYDYTLHYDCTPVKGSLANQYANCHGELCRCRSTHVNIAPNDYVS